MNRAGITARRASMVLVVLGVVLSTSAVAPAVSASTASRDDAPGQGPAIADAPQQHPPRNAAPRMSVLAAAGGDQHLWFVDRRGSLSASLGHIAVGMAPREFQQCIPLQGPPSMIASFGERAFLLFPPRSAILPRYYLLSTSARRNPASGLWMSVPSNRLELLPALPCQTAPQSMVADSDGPLVLFES